MVEIVLLFLRFLLSHQQCGDMDAILFVVFTGLDIEKYECSIYFFNIMFHFALDNPQSLPTSRLTGHLFLFLFIFCGKRSVKQNSIHCYVLEEDVSEKILISKLSA